MELISVKAIAEIYHVQTLEDENVNRFPTHLFFKVK